VVDEPLALSAPLARKLAGELCRTEPATGETCAWYHGFWQYLRLLGMGTSPAGHAGFFRDAFARLAGRPARVLVAGGADYSMLAHAIAACRSAGVQAQFTMVDWCETPLALARWYAQRRSLAVQTERRNLLEDGSDEARYDALCTHALLGHFRPAERTRLIAGLARALRPGGMLFLANRLRPGAPDAPATFSAAQVEQFVNAVAAQWREAGPLAGIDVAQFVEAARRYAARQISWPVRSLEEVQTLFESGGFGVEQLTAAPMDAPRDTLDVPTVAGGADYARIVAVKR
jgi:SAM-dependent methyltransferase